MARTISGLAVLSCILVLGFVANPCEGLVNVTTPAPTTTALNIPTSGSIFTYVGLGLGAGIGSFIIFVIFLVTTYKLFNEDKTDKGWYEHKYFEIPLFSISVILAIVFFAIGFKSGFLDDPTPAYECVVTTAEKYGSLSMCQSVLTTCSIGLSAVPIETDYRCVQQGLTFIAFYDAIVIFAVLGSTVWFFCFVKFVQVCFTMWVDHPASHWAETWFSFWGLIGGLATATIGWADSSQLGCYLAHCQQHVSKEGDSPANVTKGLEIYQIIMGTKDYIVFILLVWRACKR